MAFTVTDIQRGVIGDLQYVFQKGVSTSGTTGGDFTTGLGSVLIAAMVEQGTATQGAGAVINETFPLASGAVTVVTAANATVYLLAFGTA